MEQLPFAPVVQVKLVAVSLPPCGGAPSTGALSVNKVNTAPDSGAPRSSCLWMFTVPQFVMFTGTGAMKSFSSEPNELPEERLFRYAEPKCSHTPGGKMPEPVGLVPVTGALFTWASALLPRMTALSQHGSVLLASHWVVGLPVVIQVCLASTGTPLPPKSKSIKRSPAVRTGVTPLALGVALWLSSKSICAEPSRLERSQARYR